MFCVESNLTIYLSSDISFISFFSFQSILYVLVLTRPACGGHIPRSSTTLSVFSSIMRSGCCWGCPGTAAPQRCSPTLVSTVRLRTTSNTILGIYANRFDCQYINHCCMVNVMTNKEMTQRQAYF